MLVREFDMAYNSPDYYEVVYYDDETDEIFIESNDFIVRIVLDEEEYPTGFEQRLAREEIIEALDLLSRAVHGCYVYPPQLLETLLGSFHRIAVIVLNEEEEEEFLERVEKEMAY